MDQEKCTAIEDYLKDEFPSANIVQKEDFTMIAQRFRIDTENDILMLRVSKVFIDDTSIDEIIQKLKAWHIPKLLQENSSFGIHVTSSGPNAYQRT